MIKKIKEKLATYRRIIWSLSKPSKDKIKEDFKINLIGIFGVGVIGFLIQLLFYYVPTGIASIIIAIITFIIYKSLSG